MQTRTAYASAQVAWDQTCQGEAQTRVCDDGMWSPWTGTYAALACEVTPPRPCSAPDAPHGASEQRTRYASATVPVGASCQAEEQSRSCVDGTWTAWSGSAQAESCKAPVIVSMRVAPARPRLDLNGSSVQLAAVATLDDGQEVDVTSLVTWSSLAPSVIEVFASGKAVPTDLGQATLRASFGAFTADAAAVVSMWQERTVTYSPGPHVDLAGNGADRVIAAWDDRWPSGTAWSILVSTWASGIGWATDLPMGNEEAVVDVRAATSTRGDLAVLWQAPTSVPSATTFYVRARHRVFNASSWSTAVTLSSTSTGAPVAASVAHVGRMLASWLEDGLQALAPFVPATGWSLPPMMLAGRYAHEVAVDPLGNGVVVAQDRWLSPTVGAGVYAYHFTASSGAVGNRVTVYETDNVSGQPAETITSPVRVAVDASGRALVVWARERFQHNAIVAARYAPGSGWTAPEVLLDVGDAQIILANLSMHASGTAALAFSSNYIGAKSRIHAITYAPGSGWGAPTALSPADRNVSVVFRDEVVAAGPDGRAMAVWQHSELGHEFLYYRLYEPDAGWGAQDSLTLSKQPFSHEQVLALKDGFLVGYVEDDGTSTRLVTRELRW
jgi:hypothetical protein